MSTVSIDYSINGYSKFARGELIKEETDFVEVKTADGRILLINRKTINELRREKQ